MTPEDSAAYRGKRVLITGDTGFKGAVLSRVVRALGAEVYGYSLHRTNAPRDVRDSFLMEKAIREAQPDFVFHLAAQSTVPASFLDPHFTFETNVMGTVNLLNGLLAFGRAPCAVVVVTSDKCYLPTGKPHVETDHLGGRDPYAASKAAAEQVVTAFREGFFAPQHAIAVATARAGNVIGPGDTVQGRLIPNAVKALREGRPIPVWNTAASRPWQSVYDVVAGYLTLGAALAGKDGRGYAGAWNFGPDESRTVVEVVEAVIREWGAGRWEHVQTPLRETTELRLDSTKAKTLLGWKPQWAFEAMIRDTIGWYKAHPEVIL